MIAQQVRFELIVTRRSCSDTSLGANSRTVTRLLPLQSCTHGRMALRYEIKTTGSMVIRYFLTQLTFTQPYLPRYASLHIGIKTLRLTDSLRCMARPLYCDADNKISLRRPLHAYAAITRWRHRKAEAGKRGGGVCWD